MLGNEISVQTCQFPHWCKIHRKSSVKTSTFFELFKLSLAKKSSKRNQTVPCKRLRNTRVSSNKMGWGVEKMGVRSLNNPIRAPVSVDWHLLDVWVCSSVYEGFSKRAQDVSRHPTLRRRRLAVGGSVHQVHVLLICGQYLHRLTLRDTDLVLFQCIIVLSHQQWGRRTVTADAIKLPGGVVSVQFMAWTAVGGS